MQFSVPSPVATGPKPGKLPPNEAALMEKAKELEAAFLSEMLNYAGLKEQEGSFSGGIGEQQFSSFLRQEQAKLMVESGGIGLAQQIFESLVKHDHAGS